MQLLYKMCQQTLNNLRNRAYQVNILRIFCRKPNENHLPFINNLQVSFTANTLAANYPTALYTTVNHPDLAHITSPSFKKNFLIANIMSVFTSGLFIALKAFRLIPSREVLNNIFVFLKFCRTSFLNSTKAGEKNHIYTHKEGCSHWSISSSFKWAET